MSSNGQQEAGPEAARPHSSGLGALLAEAVREDRARAKAVVARRYEDFLRCTVDWLWESDAALTLTYVSSPVALKLGLPAQVLIGRPLLSLGRFEPGGNAEQKAEAAIAARRPFRGARYVMTGKGEQPVAYNLSGVPYFDDGGRFAGYRGTAVAPPPAAPRADDEEQADLRVLVDLLEEALLRQQELSFQLIQARAKVGAQAPAAGLREVPLARMAHELRTPLNAVIGYSDLALSEAFGPLTERYADCFRTIREAGRHLDQLVVQMHEAAQPTGGKPLVAEPVDVAAVVAKAKAIVALSAREAKVDISRVGPGAAGRVTGDRVACTQILVNLLTNAVKYTPPGGGAGVETERGPGETLRITVWDSGIGIAPEDVARIFEPSYRVPGAQATGLGLGLAIARDLARRMGGDIAVTSQPGRGSRFTLSLPLAPEAS